MRSKLPPQFSRDCGSILFKPSSDDIKEAFERSEKLGVLSNSFTRGQGRMTGFLGEVAFENLYTRTTYVGDKCFTHDYIWGKKKIDIKAKTCASKPLPHYTASVNTDKSKKLHANVYFFVRVKKDLTHVWLLGWASSHKVKQKGVYKKRGEADDYGFTYKVSGYHIPIKDLNLPLSLKRR